MGVKRFGRTSMAIFRKDFFSFYSMRHNLYTVEMHNS